MSAAAAQVSRRDGRRVRPALVIDGEATVLPRKAAPGPSPEAAGGAAAPRPANSNVTGAVRAPLSPVGEARVFFGRRPKQLPDLVFQGTGRDGSDRRSGRAARDGLSIFTDAERPSGAAERRMAGLVVALALFAIPVVALSWPLADPTPAPVESVAAAFAAPAVNPLVIDQLVTSIVPRGAGAVLTVEARIRNPSGHSAAVPAVRIALAESGGTQRLKSLRPGVSSLPAGRSVRFHSSVAVAKDTRGRIEVGFLASSATPGKTTIE